MKIQDYIHFFFAHIPAFISKYGGIGKFSNQSVELSHKKSNNLIGNFFYSVKLFYQIKKIRFQNFLWWWKKKLDITVNIVKKIQILPTRKQKSIFFNFFEL